ncbi:GntR family transcriptional regulator [Actinomadura atramentaria]|uniref:GntR family transcriptional regulator n=1 Tax=Actinomadura atramentaria TaxID=1990 RepID=UPI000378FFB2|nr:GntR family transcriptional regulator [Actinomadura atramentaria]
MSIDLLGPDPLYTQIAEEIARRIDEGVYVPQRAIPSEAALCEEFDVSRNTVRAAVRKLAEAGRVRTVRGKGSYVLPPNPPSS